MAKYTSAQANSLAKQIQTKFGDRILTATANSVVPPSFLAALISVEAGKKAGQIVENATRFEPHVFTKLKQVRDGKLAKYNNIKQSQIKDASDGALKALATSYGLTQIMGWWALHLGITVGELRSANHLKHAVKLLEITAKNQIAVGGYDDALRIWNTGQPKGKTHDPDYVHNALGVMHVYDQFEHVHVGPGRVETEEVQESDESPVVETLSTEPPVVQVPTPTGSIGSKIAAGVAALGPIAGATGLKIGGVEFSAMAIIAVCVVIGIGIIVGGIMWDRDRQRQFERQKLSMDNLASPGRGNVVASK